jgi:outer membrane protein
MSRPREVCGANAGGASGRGVVAASLALALASAPACEEMPWRAALAAPPSSSRIFVGESPDLIAPIPPVTLDRTHEYTLVELVDLAQQNNPETRQAWQRARAAAARLGQAEAVYLPSLTLLASGGVQSVPYPGPTGAFTVTGPFVQPEVDLAWTLLDLSRFARVSESRALVAQASFTFSRKHQEVLFAVARAYYALDASRAELEAAQSTLHSAVVVEEAVEARLAVGLATEPEVLLAREARTRAAFDVEATVGAIRNAQGALAESVGVAPDPPLNVAARTQPAPARLASSIEEVMKATLAERPDLKAQRAAVVAHRADERSARGRFAPRLSLTANGGYQLWAFQSSPGSSFTLSAPILDAHVRLDWNLFHGFEDVEREREAEAERVASEEALAAGSLHALREAWTAYFDVKTAERKVEFGDALLASSEEAYAATLDTYRHGLGTLIDLLTAERDLASARSIAIASKADLLTAAAALTLAIGAIPLGAR